ncbi:SEL1-like repeat protein [Campylobacter blaseri]|nr:SEL1-like repeat protein [Campylobacter blaseri]
MATITGGCLNLASLYFKGEGVKQDYKKSKRVY